MPRLHVSQDDTGYWQLTLEDDAGNLSLLSHHFSSPEHLIQDARDLVADGRVPNGVIVIGPPNPPSGEDGRTIKKPYATPAPQRAL